jgi:hypothetical protein
VTEPVFILGIAPRSGTNHLEDLLCQHPDCGPSVPLRESNLLSQAQPLLDYVNAVADVWKGKTRWGLRPEHRAVLAASLGAGLKDFLVSQVDDRSLLERPPPELPAVQDSYKRNPLYLVVKSPRPTNLEHFHELFPGSPLIILVRNGRAVAASSMRSWGWRFDTAVMSWVKGAAVIASFLRTADPSSYLLVRYEDLVADPAGEMGRVCDYLDLDFSALDPAALGSRPVLGSSSQHDTGTGPIAWQPVEKGADFNPIQRGQGWSEAELERFNHLAGDLSTELGYPVEEIALSGLGRLEQTARDVPMHAREWLRPAVNRMRKWRT